MSTFYIMPSRQLLGERFAGLLSGLFPGTEWPESDWHDLAEALGSAAMSQEDVYVVYAEDLPADESLEGGLVEYFGAEPGDDVIEIRPGATLADVGAEYWRVGDDAIAA